MSAARFKGGGDFESGLFFGAFIKPISVSIEFTEDRKSVTRT